MSATPWPGFVPHAARRNHWNAQVERHARATPGGTAIRFLGNSISWRELHDRAVARSAELSRLGVSRGDRVAVLLTNRPEFLEMVLATTRLGASAVPLNFRLTGPEVAYQLSDSGAAVLVGETRTAQVAEQAVRAAGVDIPLLVVDDAGAATTPEAVGAAVGAPAGQTDPPAGQTDPPAPDTPEDAPALIMYTSGTTGRPKGAVLSHQNLQSQALTIVRAWGLTGSGEINLVASPMFHIGAFGSIVAMLLIGATIVIRPSTPFDAREVLDTLERERVSTVFLVPTQWQAICAEQGVGDRDLPALRVLSWGAAPAAVRLLQRMSEVFPGAANVALFGQTEMSPVTCVLDGADAVGKIGSVGRPVSTVAMRVVDESMEDVEPGQIGEAVYHGPTMMQGYWGHPEANATAFAGGWFHSGDLVRVDADGFVYVVDRKKDMIITGGENVYCAEVEEVLAEHPDIVQVSVIGRSDPKWGETPLAIIVLRTDARLDIASLRAWAQQRLAGYKLPTALEIVEELPRNASDKVLKHVLRERYAGGPGAPLAAARIPD